MRNTTRRISRRMMYCQSTYRGWPGCVVGDVYGALPGLACSGSGRPESQRRPDLVEGHLPYRPDAKVSNRCGE
jgi:hypothetical protein